jgi:hypothetical protein
VEWGIGRWGDVDESLPEAVETEEEFDGFRAGEFRSPGSVRGARGNPRPYRDLK